MYFSSMWGSLRLAPITSVMQTSGGGAHILNVAFVIILYNMTLYRYSK